MKKKDLMKAVVFDLDNTLCNCDWRLRFAIGKDKDWDKFHSGCEFDGSILNNVELAKRLCSDGYAVLIFTGRNEKYRKLTVDWINARSLPVSQLSMRPEFHRAPAKSLKLGFLRQFKKLGYDIRFVFDDDKEVRTHLIKYGYVAIDSKM